MGQFMGKQFLAFHRLRSILTRSEYDIASHGIGLSVQSPRGFCCRNIGVHTHLAEIAAEPRLKEGASGLRHSPTTAPQGLAQGSNRGDFRCFDGFSFCLNVFFFLFLFLFLFLFSFQFFVLLNLPLNEWGYLTNKWLGLSQFLFLFVRLAGMLRLRHPHNLRGHVVGFPLINVIYRTDSQLGLYVDFVVFFPLGCGLTNQTLSSLCYPLHVAISHVSL
jgi:hypothetical protein